ncbi:SecY-interacting protein [Neptunicella sp. SCSIO 80796]|uniref:SecY-interacting protein n=1 Tax=Neptunicella plasticusilytica TaxID=3117012 RepID=UPI003A4D7D00
MSQQLIQALDNLFGQLQRLAEDQQVQLTCEFDPDWLSPCQQNEPDKQGLIEWLPVLQQPPGDFSSVESALGIPIHPDLKLFYTRYWSEVIDARSARGNLQLLQAWNADDFERLQQNLIGHILMKQRLKQPVTLFFAITDEEDFIISVDNQSGEVMLEQVGCIPQETLAPDLATFINQLQPVVSIEE